MLFPVLLLLVGFAILIKGADFLVSGASSTAKKYNISNLAIGLRAACQLDVVSKRVQ
jgi:cation:H+ antiporter